MIKKYLKYFRIVTIDVLVYSMSKEDILPFTDLGYAIQTKILSNGKRRYSIEENGVTVHSSFLFNKLNILRLLQKEGPAIGDCFTNPIYRGKSIYPFMISHISKELLVENKSKEVFIIVNNGNISSIRGIEKTGFKKITSIKTRRWLFFYFNTSFN